MNAKDNFKLIREVFVSEYDSNFLEYEHKKTKARLIVIQNEDENKVFNISFRTPVSDSTGVPHILEHSVLNGSKKYPVKEPFVELVKSSQATFLNANTYPDRTNYPVASANQNDLYNLAKVYLDAVFDPNINQETFLQEGWHYDLESEENEMIIKGVVFNEMKGYYSDPDYLFNDEIQIRLFPNNTYHYNAGGDPQFIPDLEYDKFINFYKKFYHPTNCYIYYYGNDKSDDIFEILEEYLGRYDYHEQSRKDSIVQKQKLTGQPKNVEIDYDPGENKDAKSQTAKSWIIPDKYNKMELGILEYLLLGNSASPLYKTLIESGLGSELGRGTGGEYELIQPFFSIGLKGVDQSKTPDVIDLIEKTLEKLSKDGFSENQIKAAINITEFHLREYNTGSTPKGLAMIYEMTANWVYGLDPIELIKFEKDLETLKSRNSQYFQQMINDLFIQNQNSLVVTINPKAGFNDNNAKLEKSRISDYRNSLDDKELENVIETTKNIIKRQNTDDKPEDLAKLPKLSVQDLPKTSTINLGQISEVSSTKVNYSSQSTSGISYINLSFDLISLPLYYYQYLPLLGRTFKQLSTKNHTQESLNEYINIYTGGVSASLFNTNSDNGLINKLMVSSKSTNENLTKALGIILEILNEQVLDNPKKIKQILLETISSFETDIQTSGSYYGSLIISSGLSEESKLNEIKDGITQLNFLRDLAKDFDNNWDRILTDLQLIKKHIFSKEKLTIAITSDHETASPITEKLSKFINSLPSCADIPAKDYSFKQYPKHLAVIIPTKVNAVCQGLNLYNQGYKYSGELLAINKLIDFDYLWNAVRAKGGAYGSRGGFDKYDGEYIITSWRDPNSVNTFDVYNNINKFLLSKKLTKEEIDGYIVNAIGAVDRYKTPSQKGFQAFVNDIMGKTIDSLQLERDQIFNFNQNSLAEFAKHLSQLDNQSRKVIFTDKETAKKLPDSFEKISILDK